MVSRIEIQRNAYYDSVTLMSIAGRVLKMDGVSEAIVSMGTAMNKELAEDVGFSKEELAEASENDLLLAVKAQEETILDDAFAEIHAAFNEKSSQKKSQTERRYSLTKEALAAEAEANLALISVQGEFAAREAEMALDKGLHVMMFSDNVDVEDEKRLKEKAVDQNLFMMGPDCGTAMIQGTGLGFANAVRPGSIGLVAASGTGLQEVAAQIDRIGGGITHGIGTGGRDLSSDIGGLMMKQGIRALEADEMTEVIVLVSKPPAKEVEEDILSQVKQLKKPVVISFIDGDKTNVHQVGAYFGENLTDTARKAVALSQGKQPEDDDAFDLQAEDLPDENHWQAGQTDIRGLFCGGTLCSEALSVLRNAGFAVKSNVAKRQKEQVADVSVSRGHTLLDLGEDEFTVGRPHPMIDPQVRNDRMVAEAADPATRVVLLDVELGYGSHEDPVGAALPSIEAAQRAAQDNGRRLEIVAYVLGTDQDPQQLQSSEKRLRDAGVRVAENNVSAVLTAARIAGMKEVSKR
ncbi:acyl-CoA synthetase FdrA [Salisediminibacterium halotolerans]|uniref:CoA binding domain-containing protein n=1 Tax=Salisediminibacterium halotolerans TaxID=517425 RepID=A0A1H9W4I5_9BACI|nr:acyl-CoA synthetase FdrA [Salisediminibacterium haloalkalitolerans]SES28671.1 CoA binding domain-containing protein [Salisediminibacterium haloalkalitolerans]